MLRIIFEEGDAVLTGVFACGWGCESFFERGDDERDMAYSELEDLHVANGCVLEIKFQERSRKFED